MIGRSNVSGGGSVEVFMGTATMSSFNGGGIISVDVDIPFVPTKIICYAEYLSCAFSCKRGNANYDDNNIFHFLATNELYCQYGSSSYYGVSNVIQITSVTKDKINFAISSGISLSGSFTFKFIAIKE